MQSCSVATHKRSTVGTLMPSHVDVVVASQTSHKIDAVRNAVEAAVRLKVRRSELVQIIACMHHDAYLHTNARMLTCTHGHELPNAHFPWYLLLSQYAVQWPPFTISPRTTGRRLTVIPQREIVVRGVAAPSRVSDQPWGHEETLAGASNRLDAAVAFVARETTDHGVEGQGASADGDSAKAKVN